VYKKIIQAPGLIIMCIGYVITFIGVIISTAGAWLTGNPSKWING